MFALQSRNQHLLCYFFFGCLEDDRNKFRNANRLQSMIATPLVSEAFMQDQHRAYEILPKIIHKPKIHFQCQIFINRRGDISFDSWYSRMDGLVGAACELSSYPVQWRKVKFLLCLFLAEKHSLAFAGGGKQISEKIFIFFSVTFYNNVSWSSGLVEWVGDLEVFLDMITDKAKLIKTQLAV